MGFFSRQQSTVTLTVVPWEHLGTGYEPTIRGESHYQPQLRALLRTRDTWDAALVREPKNQFDSNAVQVQINGQCVGYLAKEDAAELVAALDDLLAQNRCIGFPVRLYGGTDDKPSIGVFPYRSSEETA